MSNLFIKSNERFSNDRERAKYNSAFSSYINKILVYENPNNLTVKELEQLYHVRFASCNWDWEKHCFIPDEPEPLPTQMWKVNLEVEGKSKHEVWCNNTRNWIEVKKEK